MSFTGKVGDTYIRDDAGGSHPCIILTEPNGYGKIVVINITELRPYKEQTCTFSPRDDKQFFKKRSTVLYSGAKLINQLKMMEHIKRNSHLVYPFCQQHILNQIIIGAFCSDNTPQIIIKELQKQYPDYYDAYFIER